MALQSQFPSITTNDLQEFHARHFPGRSNDPDYSLMLTGIDEQFDEDDLGYYADGTKRTLTDQQVEIFRHSEIQRLQREKRLKEIADKGDAEVEFQVDEKSDDTTRLKRQGKSRSSQDHQAMEYDEEEHNIMDRKITQGTIQYSNKSVQSSLESGVRAVEAANTQKPLSLSANPFSRRLVSYDD
ncbi:hypothetical protein PABG_00144 [Paracoccidioides brasiliensis Pb03]|nr:hypothetical protein PABG_00144 [Paracoccidioides brasiliensis Pb03]